MIDRPARTEQEIDARRQVAATAEAMLAGELPFLEGTAIINSLRSKIGGVSYSDPDFTVFAGIGSESDHLPLEKQRSLWSSEAISRLEKEIKEKEERARKIALQPCENLVVRFSAG
jgi:hypothetical protein